MIKSSGSCSSPAAWSSRAALVAVSLLVLLPATQGVAGEVPSAQELLLAQQKILVQAIKRAAASLVSVVRIRRRETDGQTAMRGRLELRAPLVVQPGQLETEPLLSDPNYVPSDYGSGVIIDADGLILTNYHVIAGANQLFVRLHDGKGLSATVWAADPRSDLAVLRVPARNLKPIRMGDAAGVEPGQFVLALGNRYATARDGRTSASFGIISNIARRPPPPPNADEMTLHHSGTLLQTDVRLNYGTSGGALLNLDGQMIGLTTSLAAVQGFDQAAGYAIPLDQLMLRVLAVLREGREVEYGFLGIRPDNLPSDEPSLRALGLERPEGALIRECYPGTPAYQADLQPNDVIIAVDEIPVRNREELILIVGTRLAGTVARIQVVRRGKPVPIPVRLGKYPVPGEVIASVRTEPWRGMFLDYVTVLLKRRYVGAQRLRNVPRGGVLVTHVEPGSRASEAGLKPDTIITHVGSVRVHNPPEFYDAVGELTAPVAIRTERAERFSIE